jgi:zinc protease
MALRIPAFLAVCALGLTTPEPARSVELEYQKFTLPDGLEVILHVDHRLPRVAVNLWYHVGPANETAGRTGFAHLFEHLMFEGSKHIGSKAHFRYLESAGASGINGTTDFDRTNFFETLPSNQLELALWLESDRMGYLLDGLDEEKIANQRDVVRNERRQRYENAPYGLVREAVWHELFPASHPYHADIIGSHADIEAAGLGDVRAFSRQYYTPNNASLAIAGDIDPRRARARGEKYLGTKPAGPAVPKPSAAMPVIDAERRVVVTDEIELPRVYYAWVTPPAFAPGDAEADLAAEVLGGGRASRLYRHLVHDLPLAEDVSVQNASLEFGSVFLVSATARPGVELGRLEGAIDIELERFRAQGPTAEELAHARDMLETRMLRGLESPAGVADALNRYNQYRHDPGYLRQDFSRYDAVTATAVARLAATKLAPGNRVVVEGIPGRKVIDDPPRAAVASAGSIPAAPGGGHTDGRMAEESWRAVVPAAGPLPAFRLPTPERFRLPNGLTVLLAPDHSLPIVAASLVVVAGTSANPVDRPGLAAFNAAMLQEGTTRRSATAVADAAAQVGANLAVRSTHEAAILGLTVRTTNLRPSLDLLSDLVREPRFDPDDVERVRKLREGRLTQRQSDPAQRSLDVLLTALYGAKQADGFADEGTRDGNAAISTSDLRQFWAGHFMPRTTALLLAGDVTVAEARAIATRYFGDWRTSAPPPERSGHVDFEPGRRILLVDQPGARQSTIRIGLPAVARTTPDYVALEVMNDVFGGLFSSRLDTNLRETHGYTYGANSSFHYGFESGYFASATQVRSDVTVPALLELLREQARMQTDPPTAAELALAQSAFAQSLATRFETPESVSGALAELYLYDLPQDYYVNLAAQARAVTAGTVTALAGRLLGTTSMKVVVVGDRAKLAPALEAAGLSPVPGPESE